MVVVIWLPWISKLVGVMPGSIVPLTANWTARTPPSQYLWMLSKYATTLRETFMRPAMTSLGEATVSTLTTRTVAVLLVPPLVVTVTVRSPRGAIAAAASVVSREVPAVGDSEPTEIPPPFTVTLVLPGIKPDPESVTGIDVPGKTTSG